MFPTISPSKSIPPAELAALREKIDRYSLTEARERYEGSLSEFVKGAWSSIDSAEYQGSFVIDAMCDHLECVTFGHIKRLLINVPPRCSKTSIVSILYPAWVWARSDISFWSGPQVKFLCASYDHGLALESSNKSRRLMLSPWFQKHWPGKIELLTDQNLKTNFGNTAGGARVSTSVASQILGRGGDILIADDLNKVKNDEVETADERNAVKDFWSEYSSTRLNDPKRSAIIGVQQRVHQSDMSGLILDSDEEWTHICVPMRYEANRHCVTVKLPQYDPPFVWEDPRGEIAEEEGHDGQLMWPERFGEREVRALESKLGPFQAAGRLQQMPTPKGGGILKRDWWGYWDRNEAAKYDLEWGGNPTCTSCGSPSYTPTIKANVWKCLSCHIEYAYSANGVREFPIFDLVVGSVDTAFKEKEQNDFSALTVWGLWNDRNKNRKAMLMYGWQKKLPLHGKVITAMPGEAKVNFRQRQEAEWGIVEWIASTCKHYKVKRLLIEDKSRGVDVANELNRLYSRESFGVELINPVGDKESRAHSTVPLFTDGIVWAPAGPQSNGYFTKWAEEVITQCALFPKADHDDLVDSVTQFLVWARENGILIRADEMSAILDDEAQFHHREMSVSEMYGV